MLSFLLYFVFDTNPICSRRFSGRGERAERKACARWYSQRQSAQSLHGEETEGAQERRNHLVEEGAERSRDKL